MNLTAKHRANQRGTARRALASASTIALATASFAAGFSLLSGTAAVAAAPDNGTQIQEVIVTAQKRKEPLQKVPVSVQVVQGQALQAQNADNLQGLTQTMPAVHIVQNGVSNSLIIRGIGSGYGNPAFDQSVAMFEDDIYHGRAHMIGETFLDEDRLEVLKGPQSTFFGNNAIAGALNIVTAKPGDVFGGYARALYGSYGTYALESAVGGPINDKVGIRVAATMNGDAGWIRDVDTGKMVGGENNVAARVTAVFKPSDDLDITLKVEGSQNRILGSDAASPFQFNDCPPPAPLAATAINKACPAALTAHDPIGFNNNENSGLAGQFALLQTNEDVLTANYHVGGLTFTSVTGFYGYDFTANADNQPAGTFLQTATTPENYRQFSQEFRVTSPVGQTFEYMAGAYYQHDNVSELINGNAPYVNGTLLALFGAKTPPYTIADLPLNYEIGYTQDEDVVSAFGSMSWNVSSQLKLNAGLRAISDQKNFIGTIVYGMGTETYGGYAPIPAALAADAGALLGAPGIYPYSRTDSALMPSAGVQYQIDPQAMAYLDYSRGFKAGGFNAIAPATIAGSNNTPTYNPEFVNSYEVGLKSKWFDNRVLINLDAFLEDYYDLQVNSLVQVTPVNQSILVQNAASSVSQGVELESQWVVTHNFHLTADVTYLDAHYVSYPAASPNYLQNQLHVKSQNLSGEPLDFASKWSASLRAEYKIDLPDNYVFTAAAAPVYSSPYFNSNGTDDPLTLIKSSLRLDAQLTLEQPVQRWAIDIIGKNLTNAVIPIANAGPYTAKQEPESLAVQLRYKW